jgi:hypothetical protein
MNGWDFERMAKAGPVNGPALRSIRNQLRTSTIKPLTELVRVRNATTKPFLRKQRNACINGVPGVRLALHGLALPMTRAATIRRTDPGRSGFLSQEMSTMSEGLGISATSFTSKVLKDHYIECKRRFP